MKVCMITIGSTGDVVPFVALGQALKRAGHSVTLCASDRFKTFILGHGLDYGFMNDEPVKILESDLRRSLYDSRPGLLKRVRTVSQIWKQGRPQVLIMLRESWSAVQAVKPDLIVYHPTSFGGCHFAEALGIPSMLVSLWPQLVPTGDLPMIGFPRLGRWGNRKAYRMFLGLAQLGVDRDVRAWRQDHGLPPQPRGIDLLHATGGEHLPVLYCFSSHVVPRPDDWPDAVHVTGYWSFNSSDDWKPPREVEDFLAAGTPPVYVGFGSMGRSRPGDLTRIVVDAIQLAGVRGIVASGWRGLDTSELPGTILGVEDASHDWLFPRVAAVVHHGGAGTTAAGLRAGRPSVICPFFGDQPFWGNRVHSLGVGCSPIRQHRLTAERLATAIREVTDSETIRRKAAALGEKLRAEDGAANAVTVIERTVSEWSTLNQDSD